MLTSNDKFTVCAKTNGKLESSESTSLENLERILPRGVVSKKAMGALKIFLSKAECKYIAAFKQAIRGVSSDK